MMGVDRGSLRFPHRMPPAAAVFFGNAWRLSWKRVKQETILSLSERVTGVGQHVRPPIHAMQATFTGQMHV